MSRRTCPGCEGRSTDGHLCAPCASKVSTALHRTVELWPDLWETVTRQARLQSAGEGHAVNGSRPLEFDYSAADLANEIRHTLVAWVRVSIEDYGAPYPADRISAMAHHLANWLPRLRTHEAVREMVAELCGFPIRIRWAIDPEQWSKIKFGPCPETTEDAEPCPGVVFGIVPRSEDLAPYAACKRVGEHPVRVCGREWPATDWSRLGARIERRKAQVDGQKSRRPVSAAEYTEPPTWIGPREFVTVADAAHIFGLSRSTLDRWLRAGTLTRYSATGLPDGRPGRPVLTVVDPQEVQARHADIVLDRA